MSLPADFPAPGPAPGPAPARAPTWQRLAECPRCVAYRPNLVRTLATALVVGIVLFCINHLATVLAGRAGPGVWVATGISFVVPFCVSNVGVLVASRAAVDDGAAALGLPPGAAQRQAPTWARLAECPRCVWYGPNLLRTTATALVVGTVYFAVNQLGTVLGGHATAGVWLASGTTYLVPFCVSNMGVLIGSRRDA